MKILGRKALLQPNLRRLVTKSGEKCGLEAVYCECLEIEFTWREIPFLSKPKLGLEYKGTPLSKYYIPDFQVHGDLIVGIKAQKSFTKVDEAQILNNLKTSGHRIGLLIEFWEQSPEFKRFIHA